MTINSDLSRARYVGNGVTATFVIPFAYLTNSDGTAQVAVYVGDSDIPLTEGKDYTVKGFGKYSDASTQIDEDLITYETRYENGEFTLVNIPLLGQAVAVIRDVPQTQGIVFVEGEKFPAQDFENGLDKLTMEVQEVKENLTRAIVLPPTSTDNPLEIRGDILKVANEAKKTAETAIGLVGNAPETIRKETENAKNIITEFTDVKTSQFNTLAENTQNEFVSYVDAKTQEFEQAAITATEQAVGSAERSRIWAEGEQEEVKPLGGELSSMGAADLAYAIANAPEDTPIDASGLFAMNVVKGPKGDKGDKGEDGKDGGGLEIGDVAFAVMGIDETKNLRRYLNGQVISQSQFVSFTNWVKERSKLYPNTVATEENWQAEVTNSKLGQCGKFVIDDELGTIRLPKVVNINGLQDLALMGSIKAESLPNITGEIVVQNSSNVSSGAFYRDGTGQCDGDQWYDAPIIKMDASRSSSTYQDNAPVQQEAIQYPYFIQVATGVEESVDVTREIELNIPFFFGMSQYFESDPNNASWLISNGSFHSGAVYKSFYEWLLKVYNGTEIIDGVSVKTSADTYDDYDYVINTADATFRLPLLDGSESLPSERYDDIPLEASGSTFTAKANGIVGMGGSVSASGGYFSLNKFANEQELYADNKQYPSQGAGIVANIELSKNESVMYFYANATVKYFRFTYFKGNGSLYFYVGETIQDVNVIVASGVLSAVADLKNAVADLENAVSNIGFAPDYSAGVAISSGYEVTESGWIKSNIYSDWGTSSANGRLLINGIIISANYHSAGSAGKGHNNIFIVPVSKGDTVTYTSNVSEVVFYPVKGVN